MNTGDPKTPHRPRTDDQSPDQLDALPESTGTSGGRPATQRPETPRSGVYDGSAQADPREDKPGTFGPQDDTPAILKKTKDPTIVKSSGK